MTINTSKPITNNSKRKLRILHIGNIANNAYLNAKLLNEAGFDCDVLCYEYYHIMGNPEWEDADFVGNIGSEFYPNWGKVNLRGFQRPSWFAQGPLNICIRNLSARRKDNYRLEKFSRYQLRLARTMEKRSLPILMLPFVFSKHALSFLRKVMHFGFLRVMSLLRTMLGLPHIVPYDSIYQELSINFSRAFPDRSDQLFPDYLKPYLRIIDKLRQLFEEYDVIQAYGTDPILALFSGVRPYLAFEHGTIRSIPFENTPQGRLTALSYRLADGVIITNSDNKRAADRLELPDYRFVPHPINEKWLKPGIGQILRKDLLSELNVDFLIFHPSRQHWDAERHPSWEKGNDILIEGMARAVQEGINLAAVFVEWGKTVPESKALLAELGLEKRVMWVKPMNSANMARYIDACDLLADQFFLGAFGSTMPRALALGKPAMIYLDEDIHRWCFPEMPPIINTRTSEQVFEGLKHAYEDQEWFHQLGEQGKKWYQTYHSNVIIRDRLIEFYNDILDNREPL